jgi:hypothetical protein
MGRFVSGDGGGASPADMPPKAIHGRNNAQNNALLVGSHIDTALSGALAADTYKEVLNLSSPGVLKFCGFKTNDTTARNGGMRIVIDGEVAYDITRGSLSNGWGLLPVGTIPNDSTRGVAFDRVPFNTLSVSVKSSLTETDTLTTAIAYDLV